MAYALIHATILDGTKDMKPQDDMTVIVDDTGLISSIEPFIEDNLDEDMKVYDLQGAYLLPGLINLHCHFCGSGKPTSSNGAAKLASLVTGNPLGRAYLRHEVQKHAEDELMSGVTTVRGSGDPVWADIQTRNAIDEGKFLGPRILAPGWGVTPPSGHGRGIIALMANTEEEARDIVRDIAAHDANCVKLLVTGGVFDAEVAGEPGMLRMPLEMISAACDEAHKHGLHVAAHVESTEGIEAALKGGVDTIEHGAPLTEEIIELFKCNGAGRKSSLTTTISPAIPLARFDKEKTHSTDVVKLNADIVFNGIVEASKQALAAGIPVGLGTDSTCPYVTHYDMWRELIYFHELVEVSNNFALHTATQVNASILGIDKLTGTIAEGKSADMIVVEKNPLEDLEALRNVKHVMVRGNMIEYPQAKHLKQIDADLDEVLHI